MAWADGRSKRRYRNAELLYDAACELLVTRSFDELAVEDICAHAGVGRATFFRIFETKAGLLREFNRRLARDAAADVAAAGATGIAEVLEVLRQTIYRAWQGAGPGLIRMAAEHARAAPSSDPHAAHPELFGLVLEAVSAAVEAGELSDAVPVELAASLALVQIIAPMTYMLSGSDVDIEALSKVLLHQWLRGMAPTGTKD
ncbi:TetR/AcrR family transcriptional regulator [Nocardia salmonicida]